MKLLIWNIGDVTITQIIEIEAGSIIQETIPKAVNENIRQISWLTPYFADGAGNLKALVQAFVIKTPDKVILVDTCNGNDKARADLPSWGNLQTDFLERLEAQGYTLEDITHVLCTHLHFDHVGWNTIFENSTWVPTFPNARYLFAEKEFEYWKTQPEKELADDRAGFADSVLPVYEAGLVDLVSTDYEVCPEVFLFPTPGHTPAHVSIIISSRGEQAVITGDTLHHPCQIAHPEWETVSDTDAEQATRSRRELLERFADTDTLVIGSHFAEPTAGLVRHDGTTFAFEI